MHAMKQFHEVVTYKRAVCFSATEDGRKTSRREGSRSEKKKRSQDEGRCMTLHIPDCNAVGVSTSPSSLMGSVQFWAPRKKQAAVPDEPEITVPS